MAASTDDGGDPVTPSPPSFISCNQGTWRFQYRYVHRDDDGKRRIDLVYTESSPQERAIGECVARRFEWLQAPHLSPEPVTCGPGVVCVAHQDDYAVLHLRHHGWSLDEIRRHGADSLHRISHAGATDHEHPFPAEAWAEPNPHRSTRPYYPDTHGPRPDIGRPTT